jgi:hypothetical protein
MGTGSILTLTDANRPAQKGFYRVAKEGVLVINEIDYDQPGTDAAEFVEIYNAGSSSVDLQNKALVFVDGANNNEYLRVSLGVAGSLPAGGYLVVCSTNVTPAQGALVIHFGSTTDNIQNGAPDGVALIDTFANRLLDALSYEGSITAANINGFPGPVSLVEGTPLPATTADSNSVVGSLIRSPNGTDNNDAATDWKFTSVVTPGSANQ